MRNHGRNFSARERLEQAVPNAKKLYDKAEKKYGSGEAIPAAYREVKKAEEPAKTAQPEKKKKKKKE